MEQGRFSMPYPPSGERLSAAEYYSVVDASSGTAKPQAGGPIQEFPYSGSELGASAAGGGEGGVPLRGIVPPRGVHRDQPRGLKPGYGTVLQQAWDSRAVDKGRQASGDEDAA